MSFILDMCRPAESVMPSMPPSKAAFRRVLSVSWLVFIVSFSMQLMRMSPRPVLRLMMSAM